MLVPSAFWWLTMSVLDRGEHNEATAPISADDPVASPSWAPAAGEGGHATTAGQQRSVGAVDGPYVEVTLEDGNVVLSGVVPSADTTGRLLSAAESDFAPNVRSDLSVGTQLEAADWLSGALGLLVTLATIDEGPSWSPRAR